MTIRQVVKNLLASEASASFSPYVLIGIAAIVAGLFGTFKYQDSQIHHYHKLYDCVNAGITCDRKDAVTVPALQAVISRMTMAQNTQTKTTEQRIQTKVVKVPGPVQTVVKTLQTAPKPADCGTPALDVLRNNT